MSFAQPWMLLGTLAALIPLAVHLFDRRRPRHVPFAALAFVLRSEKRTASRLRLKRLLLYALRTLLLLAVPIALARPQLSEAVAATRVGGLAATAIVVDSSLAMRFSDGKQLFDEARSEARAALRELAPEEPATVVPCTRNPAAVMPLGFERARLISALEDLSPGYQLADLNRCLEVAARALDESPLPGRRLVVVSALTTPSLRLEMPPPVSLGPRQEKLKPEVVLRDVAAGRTLDNRAIIDARAEPAPQLGPRAWQFTFTVKNFSSRAYTGVELKLEVDGQAVAKGFLDVGPDGTAQKALAYRFPEGGLRTVTGVLDPDGLVEDDRRSLLVSVPEALRALIVNGSPNTQKYRDEAFFVDSALSAPGSPVRATVRDADAAWREPLDGYDVVFLLNVEAPPADVAAELASFVEKGGGLFISMGDRVDPGPASAALSAVLPRALRVVKTAVEPGAAEGVGRPAKLETVAVSHPIFTPFTGPAREGLLSTRFYRYVLFESDAPGSTSEVLATMDDGAPALVAARKGKGRVLVFASSVDRDWGDLPIRTAFLPLVQRVAAWLTGTLDEREEVKVRVGEAVTLRPEADTSVVVARSPSGAEVPLVKDETGTVSGGPVPEPGPYSVIGADGRPVEALAFAATLDPAASDLSRHQRDALELWFGEEVVRAAASSGPERRTPVWTYLLSFMVVALFFEGVLLRR